MNSRVLIIAPVVLGLGLASGWFRSCQNERQAKEQNDALNDTVKKTVDKLGRANFEIKSFEGSYKELAKANDAKDTVLARLKGVIAERGKRANVRSAVSFDATTRGRAVGKSYVSGADTQAEGGDTVLVPYAVLDSLKIRAKVSSKPFAKGQPPTLTATVTADKDSVTLDPYVVRVGFDVVQTETKNAITTTIRPTDPNVDVTSARSFTKELPKKNRGLWAGIGAAVVIAVSVLIP